MIEEGENVRQVSDLYLWKFQNATHYTLHHRQKAKKTKVQETLRIGRHSWPVSLGFQDLESDWRFLSFQPVQRLMTTSCPPSAMSLLRSLSSCSQQRGSTEKGFFLWAEQPLLPSLELLWLLESNPHLGFSLLPILVSQLSTGEPLYKLCSVYRVWKLKLVQGEMFLISPTKYSLDTQKLGR